MNKEEQTMLEDFIDDIVPSSYPEPVVKPTLIHVRMRSENTRDLEDIRRALGDIGTSAVVHAALRNFADYVRRKGKTR